MVALENIRNLLIYLPRFFSREVAARNSKGNAQGCCCFKPKQLTVENFAFVVFLYSHLLVIAFVLKKFF